MSAIPAADVAVVGGGPSGSTCAGRLARSGLNVVLLEKQPFPRYKTCGGGLVGRARRLLDLDVQTAIESECHVAGMRLADSDIAIHVRRDEPLVSMTMRSDLDQRLLEAAERAGATVRTGWELRSIERQRQGSLVLRNGTQALRARYVVAADGAFSRTARAAGWRENPHLIPALESEIHVSHEDLERHGGVARFDLGIPTHGYAWVFPKRQHLSVGCLTTAARRRGLRRNLDSYIGELGLNGIEHREDHGHAIPIRPRSRVLARDGVLLTGDAAGLADPVTCEGISHAIHSAQLAADAIVAGFNLQEQACARYRRLLKSGILRELALSRFLARLLYERPGLRRQVLKQAGRPLCEALAEVISGRQSYRSLLKRPANYLRLLARIREAAT